MAHGGEWRLIIGGGAPAEADGAPAPDRGARNMAIDQALFSAVQAGATPVLRLYRWCPACLSFGRHQKALGIYDRNRARSLGIDVVRRPTGGLAVLHDAELTYAVIAPVGVLGGARAGYARINQALVSALRALGVPAVLGAGADTHSPHPDAVHPCFERPAPGEVVAGGRKLVGSAQRVERHTVLQHGSMLLAGNQDAVVALQAGGLPHARGEVTLTELLGAPPPWGRLLGAVQQAFADTFGIRLVSAPLDDAAEAGVAAELERFASDAWTWRR